MTDYQDQMNDDVTNRTDTATAEEDDGPPIKGGTTASAEDDGPPIKGGVSTEGEGQTPEGGNV